ncbi:hypothetical protein KJ934_00140 [Patescibacteria group bacterium]|nr:hypothetical protein [Patescibacteria group bacterium]MBU4353486.1 hypothetical protein [Patescibacteria group bacterium]MBU4477298.1 hypothetical protein [Patescibacteria group bacterium]MCG2699315.1 hypothetical protein [Candidatus Parcubacteria bacterium]
MAKRIICDIALLASVFLLNWYWTAILAVVFMILFRYFWEGAIAVFILDYIYSIPGSHLCGRFGIITVFSIVLVLAIENLKSRIRIN